MSQLYLQEFTPIYNRKISSLERVFKIILIFSGVLASLYFLVWFFGFNPIGHPVIYYLLVFSLLSTLLKYYLEWYFTFHITPPPPTEILTPRTVDILTTYCLGEPKDMVINTLSAILKIKYPHTTYLCDEEDDPDLKAFCLEKGIIHIARKTKNNAKAGNINNALAHHARGEICVILDPDHVPHPEFLDHTLGYFEDEKIGFVQTVQGYYNQNDTVIAKAAAEQSYLFYGPIMMGLNNLGATPAIGANCIFRRKALDSIGGHAPGLTEDMHTSMRLHALGWESTYVPIVLNRGLVPWNYSSYCKQQLKWSRGTFDLLKNVIPTLFSKLTFHQKMYYLSCGLFYLYGLKGFIDIAIPIICLLLATVPIHFEITSFLIHYLPFFFVANIIRQFNQRWLMEDHERGFHLLGSVLLKSSWWVPTLGLLYTLINKKVPYIPTAKDFSHETPWKLFIPNMLILIISVLAIFIGLTIDWNPYSIIMAGIVVVNMILLSVGILMGMQNFIVKSHHSLRGTFLSKGSLFRTRFYQWRLSIYRKIQFATGTLFAFTVLLFVLFQVIDSESIKTMLSKPVKKNMGGNYAGIQFEKMDKIPSSHYDMVSMTVTAQDFEEGDIENIILNLHKNKKILLLYWDWDYNYPNTGDLGVLSKLSASIAKHNIPLFFCVKRIYTSLPDENPYYQALVKLSNYFSARAAGNVAWVWEFNPQFDSLYLNKSKTFVSWCMLNEETSGKLIRDSDKMKNMPIKGMPLLLYDCHTNTLSAFKDGNISNLFPGYGFIFSDKKILSNNLSRINNRPTRFANNFHSIQNHPTPARNTFFVKENHQYKWPHSKGDMFVKGIAYNPGHDWQDNSWTIPLTRDKLDRDFSQIKSMGANVIRRYSPGVYDYNIFRQAKKHHLDILYGFWFDPKIDYLSNKNKLSEYRKVVLNTVKKYKNHSSIIAWSIGNETSGLLKHYFGQPYLTLVRTHYAQFIESLAQEIHIIDPSRPIFTMLEHTPLLATEVNLFYNQAPSLDAIGINSYYEQNLTKLDSILKKYYKDTPYLISEFGIQGYWSKEFTQTTQQGHLYEPSAYEKANQFLYNWDRFVLGKENNLGGIAFCWQDRFDGTATWFGVTDIHGYKKPSYYALKESWTEKQQQFHLPNMIIGGPEKSKDDKNQLTFFATTPPGSPVHGLYYKWILYEEDTFVKIKETSFSPKPSWQLTPPSNGDKWRLYLYATHDFADVVTASIQIDYQALKNE